MAPKHFKRLIRSWYRRHGRHDLPWRKTRDPYRILVSEVMLQQTQVSRVLAKYREFLRSFPNLRALARAPLSRVFRAWQGMGYNRRVLYLKRLAEIATREHGGKIPRDPAALRRLPGIGPATAGAVAAFAFGRRMAFLETNIRRVYLHSFFPRRKRVGDAEILGKIWATLPRRNIRAWYYALMDYGALALRPARGFRNPNRRSGHYRRQPAFGGSSRQARGLILAEVIRARGLALSALRRRLAADPTLRRHGTGRAFRTLVGALEREGLIARRRNRLTVP